MPPKIAILTSAPLRHPNGSGLRVRAQARGLWQIGFRDFVVFSTDPDPAESYPQDRIRAHGPAEFIVDQPRGFALIHAHQNAGLFMKGRVWADLHGFAPLESRCGWQANRLSPRAAVLALLSLWATERLLKKSERILCASSSIAAHLRRAYAAPPPIDVIRNCVDPEAFESTVVCELAVGVVGGFTSRWGRPAFAMALEVARRCPGVPFRFVGAVDEGQRRQATASRNVEILGAVDDASYHRFLREVSVALLPYAAWCIGGGARQKLMQAAASALAVVSTPAGLEGYEAPPEALTGDTPEALAALITGPLADPAERSRRGQALRRHAQAEHDFRREAQRLAELYDRVLRK